MKHFLVLCTSAEVTFVFTYPILYDNIMEFGVCRKTKENVNYVRRQFKALFPILSQYPSQSAQNGFCKQKNRQKNLVRVNNRRKAINPNAPFRSNSSKLSGHRANRKMSDEPLTRSCKSSYSNSTYSSRFRIDAFSFTFSASTDTVFPEPRDTERCIDISELSDGENVKEKGLL